MSFRGFSCGGQTSTAPIRTSTVGCHNACLMLTSQDNELLTRTGPGTPMGEYFRRYWLPVVLSRELPEPDCPPIRVQMLGEDLLAFRDTQGRVGLIEPTCAHRGANLFFGRNEEG